MSLPVCSTSFWSALCAWCWCTTHTMAVLHQGLYNFTVFYDKHIAKCIQFSARYEAELKKISLSTWSSGKWVTPLLHLVFLLMFLHKIVSQNL